MTVRLDDIDHALVSALQDDAKTSLATLGKQVGMSAPSVMERVRKLEASGVITGYHAAVDGKVLGLDITSFIGVSIDYPTDIDGFLKQLAERPEVLECHHVTGGHTLMLKIKTRNTASLQALIGALRGIDGVTRTETMVVLSSAAESNRVPLDELEPAETRRRRSR